MSAVPGVSVIIYHNPACATSRNTMGLIRNAGIEPHIIEHLKTPPTRMLLKSLVARMGAPLRSIPRVKDTPFDALALGDLELPDERLLDAIDAHPILINRPTVAGVVGVRLCRPSEKVIEILPWAQTGEFRKEDGPLVLDGAGRLVL